MDKQKQKLTALQYIKILCIAGGFATGLGIGFIWSGYYSMFQATFSFTDAQMGIVISCAGSAALISYLVGGIVADLLRPKVMLTICYVSEILLAIVLTTVPAFSVVCVIAVLCGIVTTGGFFSCSIKMLISFGTREQEGRIFGAYYGMVGVLSLLVGMIGSAIVTAYTPAVGFRAMMFIFAGLGLLTLIGTHIIDRSKRGDAITKTNSFNVKQVGVVLRNPNMWCIIIISMTTYFSGVMASYVQPLMATYFAVGTGIVTLVATYANNGMRVICAPLAGKLTDLLGSSVKVIKLSYLCLVAATAAMLLVPWTGKFAFVVIICMFLLRAVNGFCQPARNSLVSEAGTPASARGTATGILGAAVCAPDAFAYGMIGALLTKHEGTTMGYRQAMILVIALAVIGYVTLVILDKRIKKQKALQSS